MRLHVVLSALLCCYETSAQAQQSVQLEFRDGRVWLVAHDAPVRAILSEWARIGSTTIVNIDRVDGGPVSLELMGVTERDALDSVLRDAAGYMIASRPMSAGGVSTFDRIVILSPTIAPSYQGGIPPPVVAPREPFAQATPTSGERLKDQDEDIDDDSDPLARLLRDGPPRVDVPPPIPNFGPQSNSEGAPPATTTPKSFNVFGTPSGSSAMPGVVTPAVPEPATPVTRPSNSR